MKKTIAKILVAVFAFLIVFLVAGIIIKAIKAGETVDRISTLPDFSLYTIEGEMFSSGKITSGPLLIIYFNPECEHCMYEISSLLESRIVNEDVKILLVSGESRDNTRSFLKQFDISNDSLLIAVSDTAFIFSKIFGTEIIPTNFIYNKDLELIKCLKGETKTETILKFLRSDN